MEKGWGVLLGVYAVVDLGFVAIESRMQEGL